MSEQQQLDASTALNTVNMAPFWSISANACPDSWNSLSIYKQQTLQEEQVTCKSGKLDDTLYDSVLNRPQAS